MKPRFINSAASVCAVLALAFALSSCKEDSIIRSTLTPAIDNITTFGIGPDFANGTDTITIQTKTGYQDSLVTSGRGTGLPIYHALGYVADPFAGKTAAGIYMQFVPTAVKTQITGTSFDSLVLVLPYSGFTWGDTSTQISHTFKVYAITSAFFKDSTYYSKNSLGTEPSPIGTATITTGSSLQTGNIQDSSIVLGKNGIRRAPHLRIKLSDAFYTQFRTLLKADSTYKDFTAAFPGLYIAPDTTVGKASLPFFRLNSSSSALYGTAALLAYTNGNDTAMQFPYLEDQAAHFNRITRNYSGTGLVSLLNGGTNEYLAMQNAPGAFIDLTLPYIQNLPRNVLINKAEISFTQVAAPGASMDDAKFFGPLRIYPRGINSTGGQYDVADFYAGNSVYLGFVDGSVSTEVQGGITVNVYRINIPREIQKTIVANNGGLHLRIGGTINYPAAYRLVVGGAGHPNALYRPKLNIIYTKQQ